MKRFQFTLQKLMDFRQQELDRQKNSLSALQADLQRMHQEKEELIRQVACIEGERKWQKYFVWKLEPFIRKS